MENVVVVGAPVGTGMQDVTERRSAAGGRRAADKKARKLALVGAVAAAGAIADVKPPRPDEAEVLRNLLTSWDLAISQLDVSSGWRKALVYARQFVAEGAGPPAGAKMPRG